MKYLPSPALHAQIALLDGVPGDPNNPRGTHVRFDRGDGSFLIAEVGFRPKQFEKAPPLERQPDPPDTVSKVALGHLRYSTRLEDLTDLDGVGNPLRRRSRGAYLLAEETLYQGRGDGQKDLAVFISYGVAERNVNRVDGALVACLRYKGLLPGRGRDELGLGLARAHSSAKFRQMSIDVGAPAASAETALELTYRMPLRPGLAVQPVIQRIARPGFGASPSTAWVLALRTRFAF